MSLIDRRERFDMPLFVAGTVMVLVSLGAAAWMLRLGDIVTALGLGLLVAAGLLLAGIGLSPETTTH
ncbi:hypothetical protein ACFR9U_11875 [Halorientalis brevis]|uniref:Major facilitator superfamily (MFS) profile domain-containing protein n=1 Tax=Halorientalis brevis TaxID=1126241 RepID=A0ABD6CBP1_9EURY|nr:hypothetical protein [Halorientalis brevis]